MGDQACALDVAKGRSAPTNARKDGAAAGLLAGPAKTTFADVELALTPVPPLAEQKRIVAKVDELMALCDSLKSRLTDAAETQRHLADAVVEKDAA